MEFWKINERIKELKLKLKSEKKQRETFYTEIENRTSPNSDRIYNNKSTLSSINVLMNNINERLLNPHQIKKSENILDGIIENVKIFFLKSLKLKRRLQ